jgi:hypothetical protein
MRASSSSSGHPLCLQRQELGFETTRSDS